MHQTTTRNNEWVSVDTKPGSLEFHTKASLDGTPIAVDDDERVDFIPILLENYLKQ